MTKQAKILTLMLFLASPATWACYDPAGSGQCGPYGIGPRNPEGYGNNTYAEPSPVYVRPPSPPPTHQCTARAEGGETCFDTRPGRIGSSFSTNAAGDYDGPKVESYPDGTPQRITNYHNGKAEGESIEYYPDGTIESVMPYQNGEIHGTVKHYRQNGTLEYDITFCNGETCGEQHNYDEQGNIVKITRFDANGDVESVQEISPGSQPHGAARKSRRNR
ncbi:MAG: toxin-antitoxin system YwqK family antitoxin [Cardiobacterium sp.]